MPDVIYPGELLVDFVPTVTVKYLTGTAALQKAAAGAPRNVAVGLQQLDINTATGRGAIPVLPDFQSVLRCNDENAESITHKLKVTSP